MLEQGIGRGVAGEDVDEGAAGGRVVSTGPYEWVQLLHVRKQLYDRTSREILTGRPAPELAPIAGEERGRVVIARGPRRPTRRRRAQTPRLHRIPRRKPDALRCPRPRPALAPAKSALRPTARALWASSRLRSLATPLSASRRAAPPPSCDRNLHATSRSGRRRPSSRRYPHRRPAVAEVVDVCGPYAVQSVGL
jgi:hypothetical protein